MQKQTIQLPEYPGKKVYYEIHGQGEPVLILHGWNGSTKTWQDFLVTNHKRFTWIIPDLPGFGNSDAPETAWTVDDYTNWAKIFYSHLETKPKFLLTHSFGGRIAAKWLSQKEVPFQKALLAAAAGIKHKPTLKQIIGCLISQFKIIIPQGLQNPLRKLLYKALRIHDYPKNVSMQQTFKNVVAEDLKENFSQIQIPIQLVWGQNDGYTPVQDGHLLNQIIKNSKLEVIGNIKHGIHRQATAQLGNICSTFFS